MLLAIHPLRDGNGRSVRAFLAATCLRHTGPAPTFALAMCLAHAGGAQRYHQAAWALRSGWADPMARLFIDAESQARQYLATALAASSVGSGFLRACHSWLRTQLS